MCSAWLNLLKCMSDQLWWMFHLLFGCWNSWLIGSPSRTLNFSFIPFISLLTHWVLGESHSQIFSSLISSSILLRFMPLSHNVGFLRHWVFLTVSLPLGPPPLRRSGRHCLAECASIWVSGHGDSPYSSWSMSLSALDTSQKGTKLVRIS